LSRKRRADERMRAAARAIFKDCIGTTPRRLLAQAGGQTNSVFRVDGSDESFVIRLSEDEGKLDDFRKERWAIERARDAGIPAPEVLRVDRTSDGLSFMLSRRAPGRLATKFGDPHNTLTQLGRLARTLHETTMPAYGGGFWNDHPPRLQWDSFLREELKLEERIAQLLRLGLIDEDQAARVRQVMQDLGANREARLNHGDLRLKNALVDVSGNVSAVIDWEMATAAPAPEWDLAVALHDLSIDQKDAFIDGYGLDDQSLLSLGPVLASLNILHYAPFAEAASRDGDGGQLQRYRRRFARLYDLYSTA
jgi:aminoglycoside phosphotransferase (APT) family kinase protein